MVHASQHSAPGSSDPITFERAHGAPNTAKRRARTAQAAVAAAILSLIGTGLGPVASAQTNGPTPQAGSPQTGGIQTGGIQTGGTQTSGIQTGGTQASGIQASGASTSSTTAPVVTLPGATTTTTTTPPKSTTTTVATTSTTSKAQGAGVPPVPVGGPPTTKPPAGTPTTVPAQPDVAPILSQVDSDIAQLAAINEYKPAQALVATAQGKVTIAGAALLSSRQNVQKAQYFQGVATNQKNHADTQLRQLALAAYMGVSFNNPNGGINPNGDQGQGTVSTPFGLTGMTAIDAQELLLLVGQHAKQNDDSATQLLARTSHQLSQAQKAYTADEAAVSGAENGLINAQQTLKIVVLAATTPGAAATGGLPSLQLDEATHPATTTTTGVAPTTASPDGAASAAIQAPIENINGTPAVSPDILSGPELNAQQLQAWWATLNRQANVTVPINDLIQSYENWGKKLKVRYDIAFAQSIIETGYFSFPAFGQLTAKDNNFAGIGACDTCATGWSFPTADTGVEAQLELLREYATSDPLPPGVKNVIGSTGVGGCCQTWVQLAGKWASSTTYGISIMTVYQSMLQWFIPQQELAQGLFTPTTTAAAAAKGPDLAPLPAPPPPPNGTSTTNPKSTTSTSTPPRPAAAAQR